MWDAADDDPRKVATELRDSRLHTLGNLTILSQPLNASVSNAQWDVKLPEIMRVSLLPINQMLHTYSQWDENSIEQRGRILFEQAVKIWHRLPTNGTNSPPCPHVLVGQFR